MKSCLPDCLQVYAQSPPSRGAWIEIYDMPLLNGSLVVAPLAGGVD